MTCHCLSAKKT
ncbi:hypothetical protein VCCP103710_2632, partial [Vibrio cholerae CP1037(10)]